MANRSCCQSRFSHSKKPGQIACKNRLTLASSTPSASNRERCAMPSTPVGFVLRRCIITWNNWCRARRDRSWNKSRSFSAIGERWLDDGGNPAVSQLAGLWRTGKADGQRYLAVRPGVVAGRSEGHPALSHQFAEPGGSTHSVLHADASGPVAVAARTGRRYRRSSAVGGNTLKVIVVFHQPVAGTTWCTGR